MFVGGYATIIHGYNRTTGDLDIWVRKSEENYKKIVKAFEQFRMPLFDMTEEKFLNDPEIEVFPFGRPLVCIDIITMLKGLNFDDVYLNVENREIDSGLNAKVIHVNDLILGKMASNRPKDQDDIEHLT